MFKPIQNILIVDDIDSNRLLIEKCLTSLPNTNLIQANSGQVAIRIAKKERLALILMDISMPEMDGFETSSNIEKIALNKAVPIIYITANDDEANRKNAFEHGGIDFISKPFNSKELKAKIKNHLDNYVIESKKRVYAFLKIRLSEIYFLYNDSKDLNRELSACLETCKMDVDDTPPDEDDLMIEPLLISLNNLVAVASNDSIKIKNDIRDALLTNIPK